MDLSRYFRVLQPESKQCEDCTDDRKVRYQAVGGQCLNASSYFRSYSRVSWSPTHPRCQENAKSESVRDQEQRNDESRKEECGSQLPRQQSGVIGLVESVEEIG